MVALNGKILGIACTRRLHQPKDGGGSSYRISEKVSDKYNNIAFHRVIKNVIVQAGDLEFGKKDNLNYLYIGTGKSGFGTINSELNDETEFKAGTVAMARINKLNTEDSQFFILLKDAPLFKGEYTPVGKVVYGLEVLDTITDDHRREYVLRPDFINSFKLLID